jgi:hypothetical protein
VVNSVHLARLGEVPSDDGGHYARLLASLGPRRTPWTHFPAMLETAGRHLRGMALGGQGLTIYHGSLFSVRAVLPDVDATDERPTLVERDGNVVGILSGKICTAVAAARQVVEMANLAVSA